MMMSGHVNITIFFSFATLIRSFFELHKEGQDDELKAGIQREVQRRLLPGSYFFQRGTLPILF